MLTIEVVRDTEGLNALRDKWRSLQARCPDATPFQTWEWNSAWWRHFGARKQLTVLLFSREREGPLAGLAPLYVSQHLGLPIRRLAWIGTGQSDYLGPLAEPEFATNVTAALIGCLDCELDGWDMADLQQHHAESRIAACPFPPWPHRGADAQTKLEMEVCPYLTLPSTWEALAAGLGKKTRFNVGYHERLLARTFPDACVGAACTEDLGEVMTALFDLHQKRWNALWLPGVLGSKRVQAFHRDVAAQFLEQDWLRLHTVRVEGAIQAAIYCFSFGGRTFYYLGGFSTEMAKYSLGTVLTASAIRQAIAEGCTEFDFLRGSEAYKYRWKPQERVNSRLLLLRPTGDQSGLAVVKGKAGFALNRVERYVEKRAKKMAGTQARKHRGASAADAVKAGD